MQQDAVAVDYAGEDSGAAADGDASMSERNIRRLAERVKSIEASNVRLHRRIENMRADDSAINQQNEQLMKQIHRLQQQLDSKTRKDPLRSLAGPVEIFANRTGVSICLVCLSRAMSSSPPLLPPRCLVPACSAFRGGDLSF